MATGSRNRPPRRSNLTDLEDQLQASTADIAADAAELRQIEIEKSSMSVEDPRLERLAARAERLTHDLIPKVAAQREIIEEA